MKLRNNEEFVGKLKRIVLEKDTIKLYFQMKQCIEIPKGKISIDDLDQLMNKKIGILNIDNIFHYRLIHHGY